MNKKLPTKKLSKLIFKLLNSAKFGGAIMEEISECRGETTGYISYKAYCNLKKEMERLGVTK